MARKNHSRLFCSLDAPKRYDNDLVSLCKVIASL
jgi:hypothetical protein